MTKNTKALAAFALAASSSALSTAAMLHVAFISLDASILQQQDGIFTVVIDEIPDTEVVELQHKAAASPSLDVVSEDADVGEAGADGSQITDERRQWELRRAYAIAIPDLGIRAPVLLPSRRFWDKREWGFLEDQMQTGLLYGAVAYPHSGRPGVGPLVIAGHSSPPNERASESQYSRVFAHLPDISIGQHIVITDGEEQYRYTVTETTIVPSSDTSILNLSAAENDSLTIITCYPVGTTRERFVVKAVLQGDAHDS